MTYIRRDINGLIIATSSHYPTSTTGWFQVCQITGNETRLA